MTPPRPHNEPISRRFMGTGFSASIRPKGTRAFTLLEVLVALALFAAVSALIAQTSANLLQSRWALSSTQRGDYAFQQWAMDEILSIESRDDLESGGRLNLPGQRAVSWSAQLEPVELLDTFNLHLRLDWSSRRGSASNVREFDIKIYRPNWMTPQEREGIMRQRESKWQELVRDRNLTIQ